MKRAACLAVLSCLAAAVAPSFVSRVRAQTAPAPRPSPSPNLQVLQDLSPFQLQRTMSLMRASLGVHCDHCHVVTEQDGWQWAKDDKPTKRTARGMIRMVMAINRDNFDGQPVVSCNTCHRGSTRPVLTASLPQEAPSFPTPARDRSGDRRLDQILERYTGAVGGAAAADRLATAHTVRLRGLRESWDGQSTPFELVQSGPRVVVTLTTVGGKVVQMSDGATGWVNDAKGTRDMTPDEVAFGRAVIEGFRPFATSDVGEGASVEGRDRAGDREAWVVLTHPDAHTRTRLFFDARSGLLLRRIVERDGPVGRIPEQIDFADYRPADGALVPFLQRLSFVDPWAGSTRHLEEVRIDAPVDESVFRRPPGEKQASGRP